MGISQQPKIKLFVEAERLKVAKKYNEAVQKYKEVLKLDPKFFEVEEKLGDTFHKMEIIDAAIRHLVQAANGYIKDKKFLAAAKVYKKIVMLDPSMSSMEAQTLRDKMRRLPSVDTKVLSSTLIYDLVPRPKFFNDMDPHELAAVVKTIEPIELAKGVDIFTEGDTGRSLYVIYKGKVAVKAKNRQGQEIHVATLSQGEFFGEFGFLTGIPRTATLTTMTECSLFELSHDKMRAIIKEYPHVGEVLHSFYKLRFLDLILAKTALFRNLTPKERNEIIQKFTFEFYPQGRIIVKEGSIGGDLYLVKSGELRVYTKSDTTRYVHVGTLGTNDFFGEVSFLTESKRTATVVAYTDAEVLKITKADMEDITNDYPQILDKLNQAREDRAYQSLKVYKSKMQQKE